MDNRGGPKKLKNIIEINGRKYDAQSGRLISGSVPINNAKTSLNSPVKNAGVIDGFQRVSSSVSHQVTTPIASSTPQPKPSPSPITTKKPNPSRQVLDGLKKRPQRAVTLSRKVVKNPQKKPTYIHAKSTPKPAQMPATQPTKASVFKKVPQARLARAITSKTSSAISRFSNDKAIKPVLNQSLSIKRPANEPTQPSQQPIANHSAAPVNSHVNSQSQVFAHQVKPASNRHDQKAPKQLNPFHKKTHHNLRLKRHLTGLVAACFALMLFLGFLAYQRVPQIAVKVAARNAGFNAKVPSAIPSGYSFKSPVNVNDESLSIRYHSNTDSRAFTLTQKPTAWTSESLLSNFLIDSKRQYQTYYDKGLTVFIYDNNNATWVDKGVWFTLEGNGSLSSEQILSIASSI